MALPVTTNAFQGSRFLAGQSEAAFSVLAPRATHLELWIYAAQWTRGRFCGNR